MLSILICREFFFPRTLEIILISTRLQIDIKSARCEQNFHSTFHAYFLPFLKCSMISLMKRSGMIGNVNHIAVKMLPILTTSLQCRRECSSSGLQHIP